MVQQLRLEFSEHLEAVLRGDPQEYGAVAGASDPPTLVEWTSRNYPGLVENFGLSCFSELVDNPKIGQKILSMKWWLWDFTREQIDLLIADQPCVFTHGIDHADLIVALPIGPRKAFLATRSDRGATSLRRLRPKELLVRLNESSLKQARVRIYARDTSPRRFICNRLVRRRSV
jgi:hypothetical protein